MENVKVEINLKDLTELYRDAALTEYSRSNLEKAKDAIRNGGTIEDVKKELGL